MPEPPRRGFILVVDDSNVARATVTARLSEAGLQVREASGCADAAAIDVTGFVAALLDLELGDGTGVDVARALRTKHASLPIAFLTSAPTARLAVLARELGPVFEKGPQLSAAIAWVAGCSERF